MTMGNLRKCSRAIIGWMKESGMITSPAGIPYLKRMQHVWFRILEDNGLEKPESSVIGPRLDSIPEETNISPDALSLFIIAISFFVTIGEDDHAFTESQGIRAKIIAENIFNQNPS